jgi:hypothetical protein
MSVGIEEMPAAAEISCSASVSTFAKVISGYYSEAAWKIGAKDRQGPHHAAQKSTTTMPLFSITPVNSALVTSTVAIVIPFSLLHCLE